MAFRVFFDIGVLLDFTLKGKGYDRTRRLMSWTVDGRIQAYVTPSVLQDTARQLKQVYGPVQANELMLALLAELSVIDTGYTVIVSALHSTMSDREEALSYYTALNHKLDYFITNNSGLCGLAVPTLPVCTPEEFLNSNQ